MWENFNVSTTSSPSPRCECRKAELVLSAEAAQLCAVLISMPDPRVQNPTEFEIEIEKFLRDYENPRGLQKNWLELYLGRPRPQLAIDVIRAFDKNYKLERSNGRLKLLIYFMALIVSPLLGEVVKLLFAHLLQ